MKIRILWMISSLLYTSGLVAADKTSIQSQGHIDLRSWSFEDHVQTELPIDPLDWIQEDQSTFLLKIETGPVLDPLRLVSELRVPFEMSLNKEPLLSYTSESQVVELTMPLEHAWGVGYELRVHSLEPDAKNTLSQMFLMNRNNREGQFAFLKTSYALGYFIALILFHLACWMAYPHQRGNLLVAAMGFLGYCIVSEYVGISVLNGLLYPLVERGLISFPGLHLTTSLGLWALLIFVYFWYFRFIDFFRNLDWESFKKFFTAHDTFWIWGTAIAGFVFWTMIELGFKPDWRPLSLASMPLIIWFSGPSVYLIANNGRSSRNTNKRIIGLRASIKVVTARKDGLVIELAQKTNALRQSEAKMDAIFSSMNEGVFSFGEDFKLMRYTSAHLRDTYSEEEISTKDAMSLLFDGSTVGDNERNQCMTALEFSFGQSIYGFEGNEGSLPKEIHYLDGRVIQLRWVPYLDENDDVSYIQVLIHDRTKSIKTNLESEQLNRQTPMLKEIMAIGNKKWVAFYRSSTKLLAETKELSKAPNPDLGHLFRLMHTVKGNARTYKLSYLVDLVHSAETYLDTIRKGEASWNAHLVEKDLNGISERLKEYNYGYESYLAAADPSLKEESFVAEVDKLIYKDQGEGSLDLRKNLELLLTQFH